MSLPRHELCLSLVLLLAAAGRADDKPKAPAAPSAARPSAAAGVLVGEVTTTSALVQVRLTQGTALVEGDVPGVAGVVQFRLYPLDGPATRTGQPIEAQTQVVPALPERDFIARASFTGLRPATRYLCETSLGLDESSLAPGPRTRFRTIPGAGRAEPVEFVVVTGMNYAKFHGDRRIDPKQHVAQNNIELAPPYAGPDKHLGYPALETILALKPDFFVGTGDNVYYDTPTQGRAETIEQMRRKWHEQFIQPRYVDLFAAVPTYWEIDDHDYRIDDGDNSGDYKPTPEEGLRTMLEQLPFAPADAPRPLTYRTHRISRDLQIWLVEGRVYRSPNAMPDGPGKSIWGAEQLAWLKKTLGESDATFKLLISPTPTVGPDDLRKVDNHSDVNGFRHERDQFFAWLKETGLDRRGFYVLCGDRHWQYHAIDPSGIEEFSTGALVDENSRLGRKAGDPQSTDPQATIKQPYLQEPNSGGFLQVRVAPARGDRPASATFTFRDDYGRVLYETVKQAP